MPKLELRVTDCTPEQAIAIAQFIDRMTGIARTAGELAHMTAPAPQPPAVPNPPAPPSAPQPPAPPVSQAPQPPAPPRAPTMNTAPGELDSRGVPWHADHHAATKGTNKDGSWMRKKGSDKATVAAYEAQFTHKPAAPVNQTPAAPQPPAPPVNQAPAAPQPPAPPVNYPTAAQINAQHAPHLPPQGQVVPPPPPPAAERYVPTYAEFYGKYMQLLEASVMTGDQATRINQKVGAVTGAEYAENEDMRAAAWAEFIALEMPAAA